jgi:hypothetical protein
MHDVSVCGGNSAKQARRLCSGALQELERIVCAPTDVADHHGLALSVLELCEEDPELADGLMKVWAGEELPKQPRAASFRYMYPGRACHA